jgi:hypothetical protein
MRVTVALLVLAALAAIVAAPERSADATQRAGASAACKRECAQRAERRCAKERPGTAKRRCQRRVKRKCARRARCRRGVRRYRIGGFAYALLLNRHGAWTGPRLPSGEPDFSVIDDILELAPTHLRLTQPPNRCVRGQCATLQPRDPEVLAQLLRLRDAGIKIGAALNIAREIRAGRYRRRSPDEVVRHACRIKRADAHGLYDWLFLDFVTEAPRARQITRRITFGTRCPDARWRTMTNASGYLARPNLPRDAIAHAKRFSLLVAPADRLWKRLHAAAAGRRPALMPADRRFIADVRRKFPRAMPILKLEVPHQAGRIFGVLDREVQASLLRRWARAQYRHGFRIIYPLFIYPGGIQPSYDSRHHGTFDVIANLLAADLNRTEP